MENLFIEKLDARVAAVDSLLCVGIDVSYDIKSISAVSQAARLVEATQEYAAAYKINAAYFLARPGAGLDALDKVIHCVIPKEIPVILDWKCCGDIKETAEAWASFVFDELGVDAVTLSPYMGIDNLQPWFDRNKGVFVLCRTSNRESDVVQRSIWDMVASEMRGRGGLVFGASRIEEMKFVRQFIGHEKSWFLIPGVGAQGQDLSAAVKAGRRSDKKGILINVSRGISQDEHPGEAAKRYRDLIRIANE